MPEATDQQMQVYCDTRIRVFSEMVRAAYNSAKDHKLAIDDEYARASSGTAWADARTDGPPHLLQAGGGANPDDVLNFNAFITAFITFIDGSASWPVLERACVRPVNG